MNVLTRDNSESGFTLLEVLIALVILAVGILGVATMQISAIQGNSKGRQISEATNAGADRIEQFLSMGYDDAAWVDVDGDGTNQDANGDGIDDNGGNFGLDDLINPDGAADRDGDGTNDIFWNIAVDHPLPNTKTIKFHIDPPGSGKRVELIFIKADII